MSKREEQPAEAGRRGFLKLGLGSVAAGAALAAGGLAAGTAQAVEPAKTDGYAETDHVRTYYKSAAF